jgi:hypothetical protein
VSAYVSIREHTSAYVSIRHQHTSAYRSCRGRRRCQCQRSRGSSRGRRGGGPRWSIVLRLLRGHNLHASAHVSTCQHTPAFVSLLWGTTYLSGRHNSAYVSIRQNTSAYVRIRQHTSASGFLGGTTSGIGGHSQADSYVSIRHTTYVIREHSPASVNIFTSGIVGHSQADSCVTGFQQKHAAYSSSKNACHGAGTGGHAAELATGAGVVVLGGAPALDRALAEP